MLNHIYIGVQRLLQAKIVANPDNPMLQGMTTRELIELGNFSPSSLHMALQEKTLAAKYGIHSITPNKKRNALYAFSQSVMDAANSGAFVASAGIDPKVQAAEVNKVVVACENPDDHYNWKQVFDALTEASERTNTPRVNIMTDVMTYIKEYVP